MRIDTSEPSLTALFNKGQVGLIRTEFMRKDDVIAGLRAENTALWAEKATDDAEFVQLKQDYLQLRIQNGNLAAENERLRKAGDAMMEAYCESNFYELQRRDWKSIPSVGDWLAAKEGRDAK